MTAGRPSNASRAALLPVRLVLGLGSLLLLAASGLAAREWAFLRHSEDATAVISEIATASMRSTTHWATDYRAGSGYRVIATFRAPDGHSVIVRSPVVSSFTRLKAGDRVTVNYPPGRPDDAVLALFGDRWLLPLILGSIGGLAFVLGAMGTWLLRQPGTRVSSVRSSGFRASVTSVVQPDRDGHARDGGSPAPAEPAINRPMSSSSGAARWMALAVVIGLATILTVLLLQHHQLGAKGAIPIEAGFRATGSPQTLKAEPPTMPFGTHPQARSSSDTTAQTTAADTLTAMAVLFLADPERVTAAQAVLRDQAVKLSLACADLRFVPGATLVMATPFPRFDASGMLLRGLVRQRFTGVGCPGRTPLFNVWTYADGAGAPARSVAGYLGSTRADPALMRDATPIVLGIAARIVPACRQLVIADTRLPTPVPAGTANPWAEEWLVTGCGQRIALTVRFIPDPTRGMTRIEVPQDLARRLDPE